MKYFLDQAFVFIFFVGGKLKCEHKFLNLNHFIRALLGIEKDPKPPPKNSKKPFEKIQIEL